MKSCGLFLIVEGTGNVIRLKMHLCLLKGISDISYRYETGIYLLICNQTTDK